MFPLDSNASLARELARAAENAREGKSAGRNGRHGHGVRRRWLRLFRFLALVAADQLAILLACLLTATVLPLLQQDEPWPHLLVMLRLLAPAGLLVFATHDLYGPPGSEPGIELRRITLASSTLFGLLFIASLVDGRMGTWSGSLIVAWLACIVLVPSCRALARHCRACIPWLRQRVLVLGDGEEGRSICYWLSHRPELGLVPLGPLDGSCTFEDIERVASETGAIHLVVTPSASENPDLTRRLSDGLNGFERVTIVPRLAAYAPVSADRQILGQTWGVAFPPPLEKRGTRIVKRSMDYALGIPLTLLALPVIGVLVLWIKIVSPGSAMFRHRRIGRGEREFDVIKLRSMCPDAEQRLAQYLEQEPEARREWERHFKLEKDPRLLHVVGTFLRKTSLDELPQLFNVLRGEMSLVGPRPLPPYHMSRMPAEFCRDRQRVLPGLTGLWQVSERANGDLEALQRLDEYYLRNWSIWLDLRILGATALAVVRGRGAL